MAKRFLIAAMVAASLVATRPALAKTDVVIGDLDWPGATVIADILQQVMTQYLDADVSRISATEAALYESMNKGDGSVDIVPDMWTDHLGEQMKKYVLSGSRETIILNKEPYLGTEGIFIPTYVAEQYNIHNLTDLAKPEIAKLFDINGTGKGQLWVGAEGWESSNREMVRLNSAGVTPNFELTTVDQTAFLAQMKAAFDKKKPIAFYYWTPEWIFAAYDLTKLAEPPFDGFATDDAKGTDRYNPKGCYTFYQPAVRSDWLNASSIKCSEPPTRVHVAYSKALADRAPKIAQFLSQVALDADTVNKWILAASVDKKDPAAIAKEWVSANEATVKGIWLKGVN